MTAHFSTWRRLKYGLALVQLCMERGDLFLFFGELPANIVTKLVMRSDHFQKDQRNKKVDYSDQ